MYEVKTNDFSGPMEKLLFLIQEKKMDINNVALAEVTADFLAYVKKLKELEKKGKEIERLIADFIVVAARLLLIKSKTLLPEIEFTEEEEAEVKDFELRLKIYKEMKEAVKFFVDLKNRGRRRFSRELFFDRPAIFHPSRQLKLKEILATIKKVTESIKSEIKEEKREKKKIVTVEEKMAELLSRIKEGFFSFSKITGGRGKEEVVALFLAVLHLIRDRLITVSQENNFSDVIIKKQQ